MYDMLRLGFSDCRLKKPHDTKSEKKVRVKEFRAPFFPLPLKHFLNELCVCQINPAILWDEFISKLYASDAYLNSPPDIINKTLKTLVLILTDLLKIIEIKGAVLPGGMPAMKGEAPGHITNLYH